MSENTKEKWRDKIDLSMQDLTRIDSQFEVLHGSDSPDMLRVEVHDYSRSTMTRVHFWLSDVQEAIQKVSQSSEWVTLKDLDPGAIFMTQEHTYAVKSEYRYGNEILSQCQCILLASGEYAHFRDGNATLVQEVKLRI